VGEKEEKDIIRAYRCLKLQAPKKKKNEHNFVLKISFKLPQNSSIIKHSGIQSCLHTALIRNMENKFFSLVGCRRKKKSCE
jgi:hypothetical protein